MNKLIIVLIFLTSNLMAQGNFNEEWSKYGFVGITQMETSNNIPEIVTEGGIYDGATKVLKYPFGGEYYQFIDYIPTSQNIDVNNDGINEYLRIKRTNTYGDKAFQVTNGATGASLYISSNYSSFTGYARFNIFTFDIDADGYIEIIFTRLYEDNNNFIIIYSTTAQTVAVNNENTKLPDNNLKQNYPNPFNPSTKIDFALSKNANVKLTIYDITGKEVFVLVNENRNAGKYSEFVNGTNLTSGTYFYQLTVDGIPETKKMILVK